LWLMGAGRRGVIETGVKVCLHNILGDSRFKVF
jgi:hypothetical protein